MDYATIAKEAAILIAIFAPASAALVDLFKYVIPAISGEWAATIAGALTVTATACGVLGILPEWVPVVAIAMVALYAPKIVRDVARAPRKAAEHIAMITEWDDDDQGEGA